ncbi:MAG TPA: penicillin acylase family protein [Stellaceae bacterium]|nr:penicillin acylase family protein [Stellaceae bacterium]
MRRRIAVFLLLIPLLAGAAGWLWLRSSLPPQSAERVVDGLLAPVRIDRDASGIPTITAANELDAAFAIGFVHAEDRLFQMDLQRHYAAGRLAEWFGEPALNSDEMMRTLGLSEAASRQFAVLSSDTQAVLRSYAAGVNAFLENRRTALPPEYYLLRASPERWQAQDTLLWGKLMAWQLAGTYRAKLVRARVATQVKPEELPILYPAYPKDGPTVLSDLAPILRKLPLDGLIERMAGGEDPVRASNNWVVSGARSVSGKPVLANDPHLGLSAPGVWYLVRVVTPQHSLTGGTMAGAPTVLIGHNERVAWGFTNTGSDVSDLFIEKLDPVDPKKYLTPAGAEPFITRTETIGVRGAAPVQITVRATRHGPVISDLVSGQNWAFLESGYVLALQATYLMDGDRTPQAFWEIDRATDWESFQRALAKFDAPEQNVVYADVEGHIAFAAPARVPIRGKGDGWLPVPGWTGEYDWTGFIPFDQLPITFDPPGNAIVTANNKIVPDSYPYFLTRDWDEPFRAERIATLLARQPQSMDSSSAIQRDRYSMIAARLLPLMIDAPAASPEARAAIERLRGWNMQMDKDKVEPLIFTAWLRELTRALLAEKLGTAFEAYWGLRPAVIESILTEHQDWCNTGATDVIEVCSEQLAAALDRALDQLKQAYGDNMDDWRWGRAHPAEFRNPVLSHIPLVNRIFDLNIPADGGSDTINRGDFNVRNAAAPYEDIHGPGLRMVVDMADPSAARFMVVPGQSGNPLSPNYADLMRPWRDGYMMVPEKRQPVTSETLVPP